MLAVGAIEHRPKASFAPVRQVFHDVIRARTAQRFSPPAQSLGIDRADELADARLDFGSPARTVEHAIMADARLHIMHVFVVGNRSAKIVRGFRLPEAADIVPLALDGHQSGFRDCGAVDVFAPVHQFPVG